ncbi:DUF6287 domain-containing protein [Bifidobacterium aemilianum]|uniref:DUF6287 domain-containing protein n=1 Tax=Bifidobacterium aemilianum TaxID=2493120 RepID=UPI001F392EDA|nr:DUF6287 domain-containing protein [Bifidobacterium aemilianum]
MAPKADRDERTDQRDDDQTASPAAATDAPSSSTQPSEAAATATDEGQAPTPTESTAIPATTPTDKQETRATTDASQAAQVDTETQSADPSRPHPHRMRFIVLLMVVLALVLSVSGFAGYNYYRSHSRSYALSQYKGSKEALDKAQRQLASAITQADKSAGKIKQNQVDRPTTVSQYSKSMSAATKEHTAKAPTIKHQDTASIEELNAAAASNLRSATSMTDAGKDLSDKAKAVVDSKASADKTLSPVDQKVKAAEDQKKASDKEAQAHSLDLKALAAGDYSSLEGTWTNQDGAWMKIEQGKVIPQNPIEGTIPPYPLVQCKRVEPSGLPNDQCVVRPMPASQFQLVQQGAIQRNHGRGPDAQYTILAVQKGAELYNTGYLHPRIIPDPTDQTRDRIIPGYNSGQGQGPLCGNASCAYYRDKDSQSLSPQTQQKLDAAVSKAQKAVDGLTQTWAKDSKAAFQCRLDLLTGKSQGCPTSSAATESKSTGVANLDQIKNGDFSSISGIWCDAANTCITIKKDGSYSPIPDRNHGKLIHSDQSWLQDGGKSGVMELMDLNGPQCLDQNVVPDNCDGAHTIWPTNLLYFPKGSAPCPNSDVCWAFGSDSTLQPTDFDTSSPFLVSMSRHMNEMPSNETVYRFKGPDIPTPKSAMELTALGKGDCSSIQGRWVSPDGAVFDYQDQCPSFSYVDGSGNPTRWQKPVVHENWAIQSNTSYTAGGGDSRVFIPAGHKLPDKYLRLYNAPTDNSDVSKDRIFEVGGMAGQQDRDPAQIAHYRQ